MEQGGGEGGEKKANVRGKYEQDEGVLIIKSILMSSLPRPLLHDDRSRRSLDIFLQQPLEAPTSLITRIDSEA